MAQDEIREIIAQNIKVNAERINLNSNILKLGTAVQFVNPFMRDSLSSLVQNLSNIVKKDNRSRELLEKLRKSKGAEKEWEEAVNELRKYVIDVITDRLEQYLNDADISTAIFPLGVKKREAPNYYTENEYHSPAAKAEIFRRIGQAFHFRSGSNSYAIYIPPDSVLYRIVKSSFTIENQIQLHNIRVVNEDGPFTLTFSLLDKVLKQVWFEHKDSAISELPHDIELYASEGKGNKKFFKHYTITNLQDYFSRLYHGEDKYVRESNSKAYIFIDNFNPRNWKSYKSLSKSERKNLEERISMLLDRLCYYMLRDRKIDTDTLLDLYELKINSKENGSFWYVEDVLSWLN